jgi:hypothetical protein
LTRTRATAYLQHCLEHVIGLPPATDKLRTWARQADQAGAGEDSQESFQASQPSPALSAVRAAEDSQVSFESPSLAHISAEEVVLPAGGRVECSRRSERSRRRHAGLAAAAIEPACPHARARPPIALDRPDPPTQSRDLTPTARAPVCCRQAAASGFGETLPSANAEVQADATVDMYPPLMAGLATPGQQQIDAHARDGVLAALPRARDRLAARNRQAAHMGATS